MPVIRCADYDCIDILVFKHLPVIDIELGYRAAKFYYTFSPPVKDIPIDITYGNTFYIRVFKKRLQVAPTQLLPPTSPTLTLIRCRNRSTSAFDRASIDNTEPAAED